MKMNTNRLFEICLKFLKPSVSYRAAGQYTTVKRPDPKSLKMPKPGSEPKLMDIIKEKIRLKGAMTVADYMHVVVTNPTEGYYMKKDTISQSGDFVTSPEISQLFGEILGIWFLAETRKMSSGKPLHIVELGPGNGTLLLDILKVVRRFDYHPRDLFIHLVEISETMKDIQARQLCASHRPVDDLEQSHYYEGETISGIKVKWYNDLKKVPSNFSWYIAHEFFDVLPVHKFQKTEEGWREILIDLDDAGQLRYRISAKETKAVKTLIIPPLDTGDRTELEVSARSLGIARQLGDRVDKYGGIALIADYGHDGEKGDTFRAFHKHKVVDPLQNPGECDLTADVDFSQLRAAVAKTASNDNYAIVCGPIMQKTFLERMQGEARLEVLLERAASDEVREKVKAAYEMLVHPDKMGERFKFMAFYPSSVGSILEKYPPLGFARPLKNPDAE